MCCPDNNKSDHVYLYIKQFENMSLLLKAWMSLRK